MFSKLLGKLANLLNSLNPFSAKDPQPVSTEGSQSARNNSSSSNEKATMPSIYKNSQSYEEQVESVLSDFKKLDFKNNLCNDAKGANPFDKIANYYGRNKDVFLFISVLRDKKQSKEIIDIISKKCDVQDVERFKQFNERMNLYLSRIDQGERDAREFLNSDIPAFFNGHHVASPEHDRNIHENLNINIIKPGQTLETSSFFNRKTERMEKEESEVKRVKIYNNGQRILTIEKNKKQQRNYLFKECAICNIEISWSMKDKSGKDLDCVVVLNINSGQVSSIERPTINGKDVVELKKILELAEKNKDVLIEGRSLHQVLEKCPVQQTPCKETKGMQLHEGIVMPDSALDGIATTQAVDPSLQRQ